MIEVGVVLERIKVCHGDVVSMVLETYVDPYRVKATFVDRDFGEWQTCPVNVMNGCGHPLRGNQSVSRKKRLSLDEVKQRLCDVHGNAVTIVDETYTIAGHKAQFLDVEFGTWWAFVSNITRGQGHPLRRHQKAAQTMAAKSYVVHWKTNQKCGIQSSWEEKTLIRLNEMKVDYDWQVPFATPFLSRRGKPSVYTIDLYIKDGAFAGHFVEIKGRWWKDGNDRRNWEWFHSAHVNSMLWMRSELRQYLGVKV